MNNYDLSAIKEQLKASPLYNLSLTNKELFHSNFIAWFGEQYPSLFIELINEILDRDVKLNPQIVIAREHKHFDISVFEGNDSNDNKKLRLLIENKVKSIPTIGQLERYTLDVNDNSVVFILLSMSKRFQNKLVHIEENDWFKVAGADWKFVSYFKLSEILARICDEHYCNKQISDYHKLMIDDYCTYVHNLQCIIDTFTDFEYSSNYFYDDAELKEVGLHDLCGKLRVQSMRSLLLEKMQGFRFVAHPTELEIKQDYLQVGVGYTNKPLIEIRFKTQNDDYVLIQIEGKQYRHCVEYFDSPNDPRKRIEKKEKGYGPSENGIKYLTDTYPDIILGQNAAGNYPFKENEFGQRGNECKYCNGRPNGPKDSHPGKISCFVYQWVKIPKETTIHELVEYIREDIIKLLNITYKA